MKRYMYICTIVGQDDVERRSRGGREEVGSPGLASSGPRGCRGTPSLSHRVVSHTIRRAEGTPSARASPRSSARTGRRCSPRRAGAPPLSVSRSAPASFAAPLPVPAVSRLSSGARAPSLSPPSRRLAPRAASWSGRAARRGRRRRGRRGRGTSCARCCATRGGGGRRRRRGRRRWRASSRRAGCSSSGSRLRPRCPSRSWRRSGGSRTGPRRDLDVAARQPSSSGRRRRGCGCVSAASRLDLRRNSAVGRGAAAEDRRGAAGAAAVGGAAGGARREGAAAGARARRPREDVVQAARDGAGPRRQAPVRLQGRICAARGGRQYGGGGAGAWEASATRPRRAA